MLVMWFDNFAYLFMTCSAVNSTEAASAGLLDNEPVHGSNDDPFDAPGAFHDDKYMFYVKSVLFQYIVQPCDLPYTKVYAHCMRG